MGLVVVTLLCAPIRSTFARLAIRSSQERSQFTLVWSLTPSRQLNATPTTNPFLLLLAMQELFLAEQATSSLLGSVLFEALLRTLLERSLVSGAPPLLLRE